MLFLYSGTTRFPSAEHGTQYIWSGNTAALLGALLCGLLLIAWAKYVWIPRLEEQEEESSH